MTAYSIAGAVLMGEWALVHLAAGLLTYGPAISGDLTLFTTRICPNIAASAPRLKAFTDMQTKGMPTDRNSQGFPFLQNRLYIQHSMNLFFVGVEATVAAILIATGDRAALLACIPPFLADIGYFVAVDVVDIGGPIGEIQTVIVSTACLLAGLNNKANYPGQVSGTEYFLSLVLPALFILIAIVNKVGHLIGAFPSHCEEGEKTPLGVTAGKSAVS